MALGLFWLRLLLSWCRAEILERFLTLLTSGQTLVHVGRSQKLRICIHVAKAMKYLHERAPHLTGALSTCSGLASQVQPAGDPPGLYLGCHWNRKTRRKYVPNSLPQTTTLQITIRSSLAAEHAHANSGPQVACLKSRAWQSANTHNAWPQQDRAKCNSRRACLKRHDL